MLRKLVLKHLSGLAKNQLLCIFSNTVIQKIVHTVNVLFAEMLA